MSQMRCENCGWVGSDADLGTHREHRGEFWGAPAWETWSVCPCCGSEEYGEAYECEDCGAWGGLEPGYDKCPACAARAEAEEEMTDG